jgi:hypothetical protein
MHFPDDAFLHVLLSIIPICVVFVWAAMKVSFSYMVNLVNSVVFSYMFLS